jgi:hypothetical protein
LIERARPLIVATTYRALQAHIHPLFLLSLCARHRMPQHLARVMARIFHTEEYLDVVPSDVAAGVVLLRAW